MPSLKCEPVHPALLCVVKSKIPLSLTLTIAMAVVLVAGCAQPESRGPGTEEADGRPALAERLSQVGDSVTSWIDASTLADAHASAEAAANLVVGPNGPGYGDRDGNGTIEGATETGLLPGVDGTPEGLAIAAPPNSCIERDVLGGSWDDPSESWDEMLIAIGEWRPDNNTMPTLASHPMRIVGWATFTIESDSLDDAREYGGHANLHVAVSEAALDC